jgi:uncharacterized protein (TIGR02145 family)
MKTVVLHTFVAAMMVCAVDTSQAQNRAQTPTTDPGVKIGEVVWATRNVGEAGQFVARPQDRGGYFSLTEAQTACPEGWRMPTREELEALTEVVGAWKSLYMIYGRFFFGDDDKWIFLPAAGFRGRDGRTGYRRRLGAYASSTPVYTSDYENHGLFFNEDQVSHSVANAYLSLRCVRGTSETVLAVEPPVDDLPVLVPVGPDIAPVLPIDGINLPLVLGGVPERVTLTDSVKFIDPVTVTARRQARVTIGYGSISAENLAGWGNIVDMSGKHLYYDLASYLPGRVGAGVVVRGVNIWLSGNFNLGGIIPMLIVVDGIPVEGGLREVNEMYPLETIESVYIDKMGTIYGTRGAGGVMIITTKGSR